MKTSDSILLMAAVILCAATAFAQAPFSVKLDTFSVENMPGLHSFAFAQHEGKLLLLGGRRDGLHGKFDAFNEAHANKEIFVVDPVAGEVWSAPNTGLPTEIKEQLQSTNMEFFQSNDKLFFIGGYGESVSQENHLTYPALLSIDVQGLVGAAMNGTDISPFFQRIEDDYFAVAGGGLEKIGDTFYLVGGHFFEGLYVSGWGGQVIQEYTDAIRKFKIEEVGDSIFISEKEETIDEWNLHRRDYNLVPQIMADGTEGLTIFSGVFQPGQTALPYLNLVNISENGHAPVENFNQYLTQYHCAKLPIFDGTTNEMHTYFFGGMSQYVADEDGTLQQDNRIPFTNTISRVTRHGDGTYSEVKMTEEMPFYVGTNSEFILSPEAPQTENGIVDWANFVDDSTFVGYIFGGIKTPETDLNPYVDNNTAATSASAVFFKISILGSPPVSPNEIRLDGHFDLKMQLSPNPATDHVLAKMELPRTADVRFVLQNINGQIVQEWQFGKRPGGAQVFDLNFSKNTTGVCVLTAIVGGVFHASRNVVVR